MTHLTHQQLHAYAIGLASSSTVDGAWRPARIPAVMEHIYDKTDAFQIRKKCTSAVRIRFNSNTRSLKLSLRFGPRAREVFKSALIVDTSDPIPFGPDTFTATWAGQVFLQPNAVTRTFDIWLPHMAQADVLSLEIDDDATLAPAPALKLRWLAYGDSITQGMTTPLPTQTAIASTALTLHANVLNVGIGGAILDEELSRCVPSESYDIISIAYGTNDFGHGVTPDLFASRARLLMDAITVKHPDTPIILVTPLTWVGNNAPNTADISLNDMRNALARLHTEFKQASLLRGEQLIPEDEQYFVDKVHPNAQGFALYAQHLTDAIKSRL